MYLHFALFFFFRFHQDRKQDAKSGTAAWLQYRPKCAHPGLRPVPSQLKARHRYPRAPGSRRDLRDNRRAKTRGRSAGSNASASISNLNGDEVLILLALHLYSQGDNAFDLGGTGGILQQVDQDLLECIPVSAELQDRIGNVEAQGDVLFADLGAGVSHGVINDQIQVDRLCLEFHPAGFKAGDLNQIVHQPANTIGGCFNPFDELALQGSQDCRQIHPSADQCNQ